MSAFWHMGGYAQFVWPAYAVFFLVLAIDFFTPTLRRRRVLRELHTRMQRQKVREARKAELHATSDPGAPGRPPMPSKS